MRSLLKSLAVILFVGIGSAIEVEKRDNVTLKAPIVATPSEHWSVHPDLSQMSANWTTGKELMELGARSRFELAHPRKSTECYLRQAGKKLGLYMDLRPRSAMPL